MSAIIMSRVAVPRRHSSARNRSDALRNRIWFTIMRAVIFAWDLGFRFLTTTRITAGGIA